MEGSNREIIDHPAGLGPKGVKSQFLNKGKSPFNSKSFRTIDPTSVMDLMADPN
jgi:hypothetical protein